MAIDKVAGYWREEAEKKMGGARSVKAGGMLYMSGVVSLDEEGNVVAGGDLHGQLVQIYDTLGRLLERNELDFEHVVKETIYVVKGNDFFNANQVRVDIYRDIVPPAVTGIEIAGLFNPELLVEVDITAICQL